MAPLDVTSFPRETLRTCEKIPYFSAADLVAVYNILFHDRRKQEYGVVRG